MDKYSSLHGSFWSLFCVITGAEHEADVQDAGVVTSFTVITPIQYRGQKEKEEYVLANVLLDGASGTIGQQRIGGIANDQVRMGMRVKAVWAKKGAEEEEGGGMRGWARRDGGIAQIDVVGARTRAIECGVLIIAARRARLGVFRHALDLEWGLRKRAALFRHARPDRFHLRVERGQELRAARLRCSDRSDRDAARARARAQPRCHASCLAIAGSRPFRC